MATTLDHLDTLVRLEKLEQPIQRTANFWSMGRPDVRDDLAQVVRLAIWEELRRRPDAPDLHLMRIARNAISDERKRGRSVDGRLNRVSRRPRQWQLLSLNDPYERLDGTLEDALASGPVHAHNLWESPTEGEAMGHILYEMLRELLSPQEDAVLALFMVGYQNLEAGKVLGLTEKQVHWARLRLQRKAVVLLGLDGERPPSSARQRAARTAAVARWARRAPFVAPATVQALLAWLMEPWDD